MKNSQKITIEYIEATPDKIVLHDYTSPGKELDYCLYPSSASEEIDFNYWTMAQKGRDAYINGNSGYTYNGLFDAVQKLADGIGPYLDLLEKTIDKFDEEY